MIPASPEGGMMQVIPEKAKKVGGLMTNEELAILCRMARSAHSIAELGCFKGRSLTAMGLVNPKAELHAVDFFGDMSHRNYTGSTVEETRQNLESAGVTAEFHVGTTDEIAPDFVQRIDLLHIDAGHSYEECANDLKNWVPKINAGGAVCVHDYGPGRNEKLDRPEVQQAVDDWRNPDWEEIERDGVMIAFRNMTAERGVLYVAYGEKARSQTQNSMQHLRKHCDLPVAVVSDSPLEGADNMILHVEVDPGARAQKTRMYSLSPFRETLFLDADTEMLSSPEGGFELLKYVDVVMGQDPNRKLSDVKWRHLDQKELQITREEIGVDVLYFNSGVIFFKRNERTRKMFQAWSREWERYGKHDQMSLVRAIKKNPVRIAPMREPFNTHHQTMARFVYHNHRSAARQGAPK